MMRNAGAASVLHTSPCLGELLQAQHSCWGSNKVFYCCKGFLDKLLQGNPSWSPDWGCSSPISGVMILKKVGILGRKAGHGQRFVPASSSRSTDTNSSPTRQYRGLGTHLWFKSTLLFFKATFKYKKKRWPAKPFFFFFQVKQGHKRMVYYRFTNTERIFQTEL